jgi:hypothetical protein
MPNCCSYMWLVFFYLRTKFGLEGLTRVASSLGLRQRGAALRAGFYFPAFTLKLCSSVDREIPGLKSETWGTRANCVEPDKGFEPNCTDWVAMSLINKAWWQQIRTGLIEERVTGKDAPPSE